MKDFVKGGNPYLPVWEHVPDGEPRVFTHNGETRVYVYGSHDSMRSEFCGVDYVAWSAPVDDLNDWRFEGEIFRAKEGNILYAPDLVKKDDTYYLYIAMHKGREIWVAESKSPAGPFGTPRKTDFGFDVGVLVDDDGRCYAYWGFKKCFACEINEDMATIKPGTMRVNMIPHCKFPDNKWDVENIDEEFSYFEAASIRKVLGKYVFIYSKWDWKGDDARYRTSDLNAYLDFAYSDSPLDGWVHGGTISNNTGDVIFLENGYKRAFTRCNNHGSICEINGQWYIFYHRRTGTDEFARQGLLEPIEAAVNQKGEVFLGKVEYDEKGEPVSCKEVEMTSQGAYVNGLPAKKLISASRTVYIDSGDETDRAYILPVYDTNNESDPVVNMKGKTVVGYKYIDFGEGDLSKVLIRAKSENDDMMVELRIGNLSADPIARGCIAADPAYQRVEMELQSIPAGKCAVYFTFISKNGIGAFDWFTFL